MMDLNQKKAAKQIKYAIYDIVCGYENSVSDGMMKEDELPTFEQLQQEVYDGIMANTYGEGCVSFRPIKEIKFCTRAWLMERIEKRLTYYVEKEAEYTIKHGA